MNEYIEPLKKWWVDNAEIAKISEAYWDAYVELGTYIKQLAEAEAARRPPIPEAPFAVEPTEPWNNRKLDPMPYVLDLGLPTEERVSVSDPMRVRAFFKPRPGFEKDRTKYGTGFSSGHLVG